MSIAPEMTVAPGEKITVSPKPAPARSQHRIVKALVVVAVAFLLLELLFRTQGNFLSKDISHLKSFDHLAASLMQHEPNEQSVLFLGNSLTRYGVNPELFTDEIKKQTGLQVHPGKVNPDNTALADWYYAYRHFFSRENRKPDLMIIGFEGGHLRDAPSHHLDRLAYFYCDLNDWEAVQKYDARTFEERLYFSSCSLSAALANRDRIQRRILDVIIPQYREGMDQMNERLTQKTAPAASTVSYQRLDDLLTQAERDGVRVFLAAMPVPEAYTFDKELLDCCQKHAVPLLDCRSVPGIQLEMFFDGLHMDEAASELYTKYLAETIRPYLNSPPERQFVLQN